MNTDELEFRKWLRDTVWGEAIVLWIVAIGEAACEPQSSEQ